MRHHTRHVDRTLEDIGLGDIWGAELSLEVEIDPGQRGQCHGPPEDCQEEIPASATIIRTDVISVTSLLADGRTSVSNAPDLIGAVVAWIAETRWEEGEVLLDSILRKISEDEADAHEAALEEQAERRRDR